MKILSLQIFKSFNSFEIPPKCHDLIVHMQNSHIESKIFLSCSHLYLLDKEYN